MGANAGAAKQASANTGLFVFVKDVENPRWRIAMKMREYKLAGWKSCGKKSMRPESVNVV